jgi:hypothetical protein
MNTSRPSVPFLALAVLLLAGAFPAMAQDIYKCSQAGAVAYTDHPCPGGKGELLHRADDSEIIDQYLRLGQQNLARQYADARHLEALYKERLAAYQQDMKEKALRQQDEMLAEQQRDEQAQQQTLAEQAASRERLAAENQALRQQNDQYRDELTQPVDSYSPAYWGAAPPYRDRHHDGDHDGDHEHPPTEPVFHPCTQLAGGRVQC